jgi:hypothetical protein
VSEAASTVCIDIKECDTHIKKAIKKTDNKTARQQESNTDTSLFSLLSSISLTRGRAMHKFGRHGWRTAQAVFAITNSGWDLCVGMGPASQRSCTE